MRSSDPTFPIGKVPPGRRHLRFRTQGCAPASAGQEIEVEDAGAATLFPFEATPRGTLNRPRVPETSCCSRGVSDRAAFGGRASARWRVGAHGWRLASNGLRGGIETRKRREEVLDGVSGGAGAGCMLP